MEQLPKRQSLPELPPSDEELVRKTLENKSFFGELVDRYQTKLTRYIARLGVRDPEDQLDVLQEIFIKTYRNLNDFDISLQFSSWIYRIAHNEAISWYRKKNVRPEGHLIGESEEVLSFLSSKEEGADVSFDKGVNAKTVNEALLEIDDKYREVIILRFFEHKEYEEISDILQIPIGSVGTLLHRGKKQLAAVLNHDAIRI
jgi:RNA polymerase sigma-70 factor (ECF subfamily)